MKKNIIVTGAAGFLGARVGKFLAKQYPEFNIITTSRRNEKEKELIENQCEFISGDLCNVSFCETLTLNASYVIHCAALSSPYGNYQDFHQANVIATQNLLNASLKNGVKRFIFISTPSIYFNFNDRFEVKENEPLPEKMVNHYAQTKLMAEKYVLDMHGKGIETIALRPRAIIGAEDTVIFPRALEAYNQGKLKIIGTGNNICDFTCARNVIEAIICAINAKQEALGNAYNITDGEPTCIWDALNFTLTSLDKKPIKQKVPYKLALLVAGIIEGKAKLFNQKKEPPLTRYGIGILAHNFTLDISEAKNKLGYQPVLKTMEGIKEYIEWHKTRY